LFPSIWKEALMPGREKLRSTLKRSPAKAQRTWIKTPESRGETFDGVDVLGSSKEELYRAVAPKQ
jgi:hypothetical protein